MRTALCLLALGLMPALLARPAAAEPRERGPVRPLPEHGFSEAAQRQSEESAARQVEFDRRIADRSNRAARSICTGCGPDAGPAGPITPPGLRRARSEALPPRDPAQAPLD